MVFSSTTFLFLFLPAVIFFYWLPDVCVRIKQFFCKKSLDSQDQNLALYSQTANATPASNSVLTDENNLKEDASPHSGEAVTKVTDDQQEVGSASEPQDVSESLGADVEDIGNNHTQHQSSQKFRTYKNLVLLAFSILFYAWGEPAFVLVMILSIIANYAFGRLIDKYRKKDKVFLWLSVIFNLGILFIFKYLCFTLQNIGWLINKDFSSIKIALPIGISFFTFQAMSYVIDVYKKKVKVQKSLFNLGLYISLFPQLIAGPIVRYETIAKEIENRYENYDDFAEGTVRFIQGLAKKVIIANQVALVADAAFETPINELSTAFAWLGAIAYTLQIYFDFSGYSDMAIGLGRMFGFHFLENFNYPYMASSITDFWRRWHISLSSWFRDYVYFPLGGSRVDSKSSHIFNLFVVWLLTGIWHGANWTFIAWGLFYFILLVIEKQTGLDKKKAWWGHIYTMFFVILAWVLFRATNITNAYEYIKVLFVSNGTSPDCFWLYWSNYRFYLILGLILSFKWKSLFITKNEEAAPRMVGKLASDSSTEGADCEAISNREILKYLNNQSQDCHADKSARNNDYNKDFANNNLNNHTPNQPHLITEIFANIAYIFLFLLSVSFIVKSDYNPFIYFNF